MKYYRIGCISRPHGIHGGIKLQPLTDDPNRFRGLRSAYLEQNGRYQPVAVSSVAVQPDAVYLELDVSRSREDAEALRNAFLCVDSAHTVQLPPDHWFIADLIGCTVYDSNGVALGTLAEVHETGANDVYEVRGKRLLYLPALKKLLCEVDVNAKRIVVDAAVLEEVGSFED